MNHISLIQAFIDSKKYRTYLEIGVLRGETFHTIKAKKKIAVDPEIMVEKKQRLHAKYFTMTSDEFFKDQIRVFKKGIDIAFIDGNHTAEQVRKDVVNCLKFLNPNGVVILHDTNPTTKSMGYPGQNARDAMSAGLEGWTGEWCGDVWKHVALLRASHNALHIFTGDFDYGCTIITVGEPESMLDYVVDEITKYEYIDLEANRKVLLNLKTEEEVRDILKDKFNVTIGE